MPLLRIIGEKGQIYPIHKRITSIGAAPDNDIRLPPAAGLAPTHVVLQFDGALFTVQTAERSLEVAVNGKSRRHHKLADGDRLGVCGIELEFRVLDEAVLLHHGAEGGSARDPEVIDRTELAAFRKLQEFSERLSVRGELQPLLEALLDAVIELSDADKGFLILLDGDDPAILADRSGTSGGHVRVARNLQHENIENAIAQLSDSIVAKVVRERRAIIVSDALSDAEFAASASVINLRLSSVMCVPLFDKGTLLGLLYLGNDRVKDLFDQRALDVLTIFAAQASLVLANALLVDTLRTGNKELRERLEETHYGEIVGSCDSMREVFRKVDRVATTDISVLITGETGTGKELIASEIHRRSERHAGPFVTLNCGAIPESLLESELFGHVRGAFTGATHTRAGKFQAAHGGTLFLDEIGEMPINLQVKMLRALEERVVTRVGDTRPENVDIRVIAATHRNLEDAIREGRMREDLYYRLNVVRVHLPPLRERGDDLVVIAKYILRSLLREHPSSARDFAPETLLSMRRYPWPGNVRELENRLKRAIVLCDGPLVEPDDLDLGEADIKPTLSLAEAKEDFQRRYIHEVLTRNGGNRTKAARELGVDPRTIFRFLEKEGT